LLAFIHGFVLLKSMANKVISMQQIRLLIQSLEQGYSLRAIASQLKISRQTVTHYADKINTSSYTFSLLRAMSDAELALIVYPPAETADALESERRKDFNQRLPYLLSELKRTGVTRLLLWEEYKKDCPQPFGYTQFCILLKESADAKATMHIRHLPGQMIMIDFAGEKMYYIDRSSGELVGCPVLMAVLPYSSYTFAIALDNATIPLTAKGLNNCIYFMGASPLSVKSDNMKQVVTKSCRYEPTFSAALQQWALHYNITLLATRVAKPKDKAAVENHVKIAYQRIYAPLRDKQFYSIQELNKAIAEQLDIHNNKLLQKRDYSRSERFEQEEKPLMQPLPSSPFQLKHQVIAKVQRNYHITLGEDYHHYSVPYQHIGKSVSVIYDADVVEIYFQHNRIAFHTRSYKKHDFSTVKEHMPDGHQKYYEQQGWTPKYFLDQAIRIGANVHKYMDEVLKSRAFTEQTYNACRGILRLREQYGPQRLEEACLRALQGSVFNYRTIQNILLNNHDLITGEPQPDLFKIPDHSNLRGPDAYQ
jgi:transposase